jgi:hypothetical protein
VDPPRIPVAVGNGVFSPLLMTSGAVHTCTDRLTDRMKLDDQNELKPSKNESAKLQI